MEESISKLVRKHVKLLLLEREENLQNFSKDLSPATIYNLEKSGQAITKLHVTNIANKGAERSQIDFEKLDEQPLENCLSQGELVICMSQSKQKNQIIKGIVTDVSDITLSISSSDNFEQLPEENDVFTVVKSDSDFTYKCQTRALSDLEKPQIYSSRYLDLIKILFSNDKNSVRSLLIDDIPIPKKFLCADETLNFTNKLLADDQKFAIEFAMKRKHFAIIQGPPGTGKTTTLVELVIQLYRLGKKVLICAPTNVAIDNIVLKLGETEVKPLRLGHPTRIMKAALEHSLDARLQRDDGYVILQDIKKSIKDIENDNSGKRKNYKELRELNKEYRKRLNKLTHDVLRKYPVILSTLNSSSPNEGYLQHVKKDHFDVLIVDEASQALEASMWIAIPNAPKLVLAGDINQLPPVVMCQEASNQGLNLSLMERAIKKLGKDSFKCLTKQYRMNEKIMLWSSERFYENSLQADDSVKDHLLKDLPGIREIDMTNECLIFIDTCGCECEEYQTIYESGSKGNIGEALVVNKVVSCLIQSGLSTKGIGVITPYALQVDLIRKSLISHSLPVEVSTVDGFQGREKEVIVLSLVRSNLDKELGFVTDYRRLNVAVTRARRLLVLIGDSETFEKNDMIGSLLTHIEKYGLLKTAEEYLSTTDNLGVKIEEKLVRKTKDKKKPKESASDNKREKKIVESVKVDSKAVEEGSRGGRKLSNKGIELSSCENRKEFNIYESIALKESLDTDDTVGSVEEKNSDDPVEVERDTNSKKGRKKKVSKAEKKINQNEVEDNFDEIIDEFTKINYVCAFENCKKSTKLIHLNCEFCKGRFCLEHGMQEIHGCGDAVRRKERKNFRHKMPEIAKKKERDRFSQKLKQLEEARKPKSAKETGGGKQSKKR